MTNVRTVCMSNISQLEQLMKSEAVMWSVIMDELILHSVLPA